MKPVKLGPQTRVCPCCCPSQDGRGVVQSLPAEALPPEELQGKGFPLPRALCSQRLIPPGAEGGGRETWKSAHHAARFTDLQA